MFVVGAEHKDKVLIKSNSVNLFSGCNQLPQCALSSTANGCSAICYVDRYTHTSQKKWISGYKDPLFFPFLPLSPFLPYDVNRPYIPHSRSPASCTVTTDTAAYFLTRLQPSSTMSEWGGEGKHTSNINI